MHCANESGAAVKYITKDTEEANAANRATQSKRAGGHTRVEFSIEKEMWCEDETTYTATSSLISAIERARLTDAVRLTGRVEYSEISAAYGPRLRSLVAS